MSPVLLQVTRVALPAGSSRSAPVDFMLKSANVSAYSMTRSGSTRVNSMLPVPSLLLTQYQRAPIPKGGPEYVMRMSGSRFVHTLQSFQRFGSTTRS